MKHSSLFLRYSKVIIESHGVPPWNYKIIEKLCFWFLFFIFKTASTKTGNTTANHQGQPRSCGAFGKLTSKRRENGKHECGYRTAAEWQDLDMVPLRNTTPVVIDGVSRWRSGQCERIIWLYRDGRTNPKYGKLRPDAIIVAGRGEYSGYRLSDFWWPPKKRIQNRCTQPSGGQLTPKDKS